MLKRSAVLTLTIPLLYFITPMTLGAEVTRITVTRERQTNEHENSLTSNALFSETDLRQIDPEHPTQVLNRAAGVQFHRNDGVEYLAAIRSPVLTGAGSCGAFLTLENGIPIRPATFCNVNELSESHYEIAHSVELQKGPSLSFYGANAMHGAVNINTMVRAPFIRLATNTDHQFRASSVWRKEAHALGLSLTHDNGWRDKASVRQQKLSYQHTTQEPSFHLSTLLALTHLEQETAGFITGKDAYRSLAAARTNENPEAFRNSHSLRFSQRYEFDGGAFIAPYFRVSDMLFLQHFLPGQPFEQNSHKSVGFLAQMPLLQNTESTLILGLDAELARSALKEWQNEPTEGSPFLMETIPIGLHYHYDVQTSGLAPFIHWQHQINAKWRWFAGLRADYWDYDYHNNMQTGRTRDDGTPCGMGGCRFSRPPSNTEQFFIPSPKLGLSFRHEVHQLNVSLLHGFRPPQSTELYRLQRAQTAAPLSPEEIFGADVQWRTHSANTNFHSELSLYHYEKRDQIIRNTDFFNVNGAATEHQGLEWTTKWRVSKAISWHNALTVQRHRYLNNPGISAIAIEGNRVDTAPDFFAFSALNVSLGDNTVMELSAQHSGAYYLDAENSHKYPGHTVFDVRLQHAFTPDFTLSLQVLNVFDTRYAERADYTSFSGERYIPGAPRQFTFSAEWRL